MKNLGKEINHLLVDQNIDRTYLAEKLGMSRQNLSRILSDKKIRVDLYAGTLEKMARILNVNIAFFFDDDVANMPNPNNGHGHGSSQTGHFTAEETLTSLEQLLDEQIRNLKKQEAITSERLRLMMEGKK